MKKQLKLIALSFFMANTAFAVDSIYTDLTEKACQTISIDSESSSSKQLCQGVSGYKLMVLTGDDRQSITVIAPDGSEHPLEFWQVITHNFSEVGEKAEWRVIKQGKNMIPQALIVRVNAAEYPEQPERTKSYLSVSKITANKICVTDKIPPQAKQNEKARSAADMAVGKPCLQ